ncbi:MAG: class I SAM-dependent methyltransferase [Burkholderiales bacterium]
MESFSDDFVRSQSEYLKSYRKKWVADPLHQWSRQWEYPFVFSRISEYAGNPDRQLNILDAGSGVTFFPYFLASRFSNAELSCYDHDRSLEAVYSGLNGRVQQTAKFVPGDLRHLPFGDNTFDIIYCISVLEHTDAYAAIAAEFRRVLKETGMLVVTFDISIDGDFDIPAEKAEGLLEILDHHFPRGKKAEYANLEKKMRAPDIVTTRFILKSNPDLLPWKYPLLAAMKPLIKLRWPKTLCRNLTFFCHAFVEPPGER